MIPRKPRFQEKFSEELLWIRQGLPNLWEKGGPVRRIFQKKSIHAGLKRIQQLLAVLHGQRLERSQE